MGGGWRGRLEIEKVNAGIVICRSCIWVPRSGLKNDDTSPLDFFLKRDHFSERKKVRHLRLAVRAEERCSVSQEGWEYWTSRSSDLVQVDVERWREG